MLGQPQQLSLQPVAAPMHDPGDVSHHHVSGPGCQQQLDDRRARRAGPRDDDLDVAELFTHHSSALSNAASTTIAVPCWSSKTGMSSCSRNRRSISKQRGAEMSSKLIPAKPGATALTTVMISSTSWVSRHNGQASMSPNRLNSAALPSITGSAASGPMLPKPSTADPSVTTATLLRFTVSRRASSGFFAMARQTRATPGVDHRQVVPIVDWVLGVHLDLAAQVHQERAVRHLPDHHPLDLLHRLHQLVCVLGVPGRTGDVDP